MGAEILTADDLWRHVEGKRATAISMKEDRLHCREAWLAAGFAFELALKAVIMKRERLNAWPSRLARQDLYIHDLRRLMTAAGLSPDDAPPPPRHYLATALLWSRESDYSVGQMPRKTARDMVTAVFSDGGIIDWLKSL